MLRKFIYLITALSLVCCLICNNYVFAYDNSIKAVANNFDGTSLVEQGNIALKNSIPNYRFCYAYDYDGDGLQEAYAISGIWEEGIVNGKLWFIDSDGDYNLVKEGLYCRGDLFAPELAYAGNQIFLILNQTKNGRVISLVCGYRNGKAYFPTISEHVADFHFENGHYYAYNIADYSGVEYFYDEAAGEFVSDEKVPVEKEIKVVLNGEGIDFDQQPIIINDRVMVPIRAIFEAMNYEVNWNQDTKTAVAVFGNNNITVHINSNTIYHTVNGVSSAYICDVMPRIVSDRIIVPVRAIAESADCTVDWDSDSMTVIITK